MARTLDTVLQVLRDHEADLRRFDVAHIAVFGSMARGDANPNDIDVLVELTENNSLGVFEYARLKLFISRILGGSADVVNRRSIKPLLRESILRDAVHAF